MTELSNKDYKNILDFYEKPIPKSKRLLKIEAEGLLTNKLCRCIKKLDKENEGRAIGICTKTIFTKKGYTRGRFKCKGKSTIKIMKLKRKYTRRK